MARVFGGQSFRDVNEENWVGIVCSPLARFINESQIRAYFVDYLLEAIKDSGTTVYEECRCDRGGCNPAFADYFVRVGDIWVPVEAKLNVRAEANLPGQVAKYVDMSVLVPTRPKPKGGSIDGRCGSRCLVVDAEGIFLVDGSDYIGCSPDRPLWRRTSITRETLSAIRDGLPERVA